MVCFRGGAFSAILVLVMCVGGVSTLYAVLYLLFERGDPVFQLPAPVIPIGVGHARPGPLAGGLEFLEREERFGRGDAVDCRQKLGVHFAPSQ